MKYKTGLPKEVYVPPAKYKVRYSAEVAEQIEGETDTDTMEIDMNPDFGVERQRTTMLHEVLHAVWDSAACHKVKGVTRRLEERVITLQTPVLLETLRRNPELLKFLLRKK